MRKIGLAIFLLSCISVFGQEIKFSCTDSIKGEFDNFSVDNFGRIYLTKEDVIVQYSNQLDTLFTASLKTIRPSSIESSKSFRTLLFDKDRSVIQFMDNTLTDIHGEIDLVNQDIQQPILVCESFGGNTIWILDAGGFRLIKMNEKLEKVLITENLTTIFEDEEEPIQMQESNDLLFVLIPNRGVAIFDVFGTYMKLYSCDAKAIDAMGNYLFVQTDSTLEIIPNEGILEPEYVYHIDSDIIGFSYTREKVYLHKKKGLYVGQFVKSK